MSRIEDFDDGYETALISVDNFIDGMVQSRGRDNNSLLDTKLFIRELRKNIEKGTEADPSSGQGESVQEC